MIAATASSSPTDDSPAAVVQRQLDAFNARDVEAIAATYADEAQQFEHPAKLLASSLDQLRERWKLRFQDATLHAKLLHRAVVGSTVIDHEEVTSTFPEGKGHRSLVGIYDVQAGKIVRATFILGPIIFD